jgi:hypothetical protein
MLKNSRDAGIDLGQLPKDGLWKYCRIVIGAAGSEKSDLDQCATTFRVEPFTS